MAICSVDATIVPAASAAADDEQFAGPTLPTLLRKAPSAGAASARTRRVAGAELAGDDAVNATLLSDASPAAVVVVVLAARIGTCVPLTPTAVAIAPRSAADTPARFASSSAAERPGMKMTASAPGAEAPGDGVALGGSEEARSGIPRPMPSPSATTTITTTNTRDTTTRR